MKMKHLAIIMGALAVAVAVDQGKKVYAAEEDIVVDKDSVRCVRCHGGKEGAKKLGQHPGIVRQWKASVHAREGIGCVDCHGVPEKGDDVNVDNPRYVVKTTWDKSSGIKKIELATEGGKPVERPDIWKHAGKEIILNVSPRTCAGCHEEETTEFSNSRHSSAA